MVYYMQQFEPLNKKQKGSSKTIKKIKQGQLSIEYAFLIRQFIQNYLGGKSYVSKA